MPSHMHLVFSDKGNQPEQKLRAFQSYTSKALQKEMKGNVVESRREWMLWMMERRGMKKSNLY